jgi:hypothetical protein
MASPIATGVASKRTMRLNYWNDTWPLSEQDCPCDLHFVEYLDKRHVHGKAIFHFGTGEHHILGIENARRSRDNRNYILGVTASKQEHEAYVQLILNRAQLAVHYHVMFVDIYTMTPRLLPLFDIVTLFHLCEFYDPVRSRYAPLDDAKLLRMFLSKLKLNGRILFYTGSSHFDRARSIIDAFLKRGWLRKAADYKTLEIYGHGWARRLG